MCGRYSLGKNSDELQKDFPDFSVLKQLRARFNVSPGQPIAAWMADPAPRMDLFSWGLVPHWARDPAIGFRMINARAETLMEKPSFKKALQRRRCLIPMDGYYEWLSVGGAEKKQPMHYRKTDGSAFAVAGLWDTWHDKEGGFIMSATIITTRPNTLARKIHHRMPAILREEDYGLWLSSETFGYESLRRMMDPVAADGFEIYPVSTRVNRAGEEGEDLVFALSEPEVKAPPQQGELF